MYKNKKLQTKFIIVIFCIMLIMAIAVLFSANVIFAEAATPNDSDTKSDNQVTLDKNFEDDSVIVTLKRSHAQLYKTFSEEDFPEVQIEQVDDLTAPTVELAKKQVTAKKTGIGAS